jgi:hypothetical protein
VQQWDLRSQTKNDLKSLLEDTVAQQWFVLTLVQEWPKMQWLHTTLVQEWPRMQQWIRITLVGRKDVSAINCLMERAMCARALLTWWKIHLFGVSSGLTCEKHFLSCPKTYRKMLGSLFLMEEQTSCGQSLDVQKTNQHCSDLDMQVFSVTRIKVSSIADWHIFLVNAGWPSSHHLPWFCSTNHDLMTEHVLTDQNKPFYSSLRFCGIFLTHNFSCWDFQLKSTYQYPSSTGQLSFWMSNVSHSTFLAFSSMWAVDGCPICKSSCPPFLLQKSWNIHIWS